MSPKVQEKIVSSSADPAVAIVLTTIGADTDATVLARTLVDERLAACVNVIGPIVSIYRWNGTVEQEREQQLVIKTIPARLAALEARVRELHPYELPEFLILAPDGGSAAYLAWVGASVS
jgi:periplasmic divalent cation tolerance protein